jgi:hypothetical protein
LAGAAGAVVALPKSAALTKAARFRRWLRAEAATMMSIAPPLQKHATVNRGGAMGSHGEVLARCDQPHLPRWPAAVPSRRLHRRA